MIDKKIEVLLKDQILPLLQGSQDDSSYATAYECANNLKAIYGKYTLDILSSARPFIVTQSCGLQRIENPFLEFCNFFQKEKVSKLLLHSDNLKELLRWLIHILELDISAAELWIINQKSKPLMSTRLSTAFDIIEPYLRWGHFSNVFVLIESYIESPRLLSLLREYIVGDIRPNRLNQGLLQQQMKALYIEFEHSKDLGKRYENLKNTLKKNTMGYMIEPLELLISKKRNFLPKKLNRILNVIEDTIEDPIKLFYILNSEYLLENPDLAERLSSAERKITTQYSLEQPPTLTFLSLVSDEVELYDIVDSIVELYPASKVYSIVSNLGPERIKHSLNNDLVKLVSHLENDMITMALKKIKNSREISALYLLVIELKRAGYHLSDLNDFMIKLNERNILLSDLMRAISFIKQGKVCNGCHSLEDIYLMLSLQTRNYSFVKKLSSGKIGPRYLARNIGPSKKEYVFEIDNSSTNMTSSTFRNNDTRRSTDKDTSNSNMIYVDYDDNMAPAFVTEYNIPILDEAKKVQIINEIQSISGIKILLLGSYSKDGNERLKYIESILIGKKYSPIIFTNLESTREIDDPEIREAVVAIATECDMVIIEDTEPSGHLLEMEDLARAGVKLAILRRYSNASTRLNDYYFEKYINLMKLFRYSEGNISEILDEIISWFSDTGYPLVNHL